MSNKPIAVVKPKVVSQTIRVLEGLASTLQRAESLLAIEASRPPLIREENLAVPSRMSFIELHHLYVMLKLWTQFDGMFNNWFIKNARINQKILHILALKNAQMQNYRTMVAALVLSRTTKFPEVDIQQRVIRLRDGPVELPADYLSFSRERDGELNTPRVQFGTSGTLKNVTQDQTPDTILKWMRTQVDVHYVYLRDALPPDQVLIRTTKRSGTSIPEDYVNKLRRIITSNAVVVSGPGNSSDLPES